MCTQALPHTYRMTSFSLSLTLSHTDKNSWPAPSKIVCLFPTVQQQKAHLDRTFTDYSSALNFKFHHHIYSYLKTQVLLQHRNFKDVMSSFKNDFPHSSNLNRRPKKYTTQIWHTQAVKLRNRLIKVQDDTNSSSRYTAVLTCSIKHSPITERATKSNTTCLVVIGISTTMLF